jgi:hypothetical protein
MASLADLKATASLILAAFTDQLEALGVDVPDHRYVHAGTEPVWDGPQFTVGLLDIKQGQPGAPVGSPMSPRAVNFYGEWHLILVRDVPTQMDGPIAAALPSDSELGESGAEAMGDVEALVKAFSNIYLAHTLTQSGEGFVMTGCRPLGVQGGLTGTELVVEVSLR